MIMGVWSMSFLKMQDENCRGEIPYAWCDTIVGNVIAKAMPSIANHFKHI
jgi:hypothetical protein